MLNVKNHFLTEVGKINFINFFKFINKNFMFFILIERILTLHNMMLEKGRVCEYLLDRVGVWERKFIGTSRVWYNIS